MDTSFDLPPFDPETLTRYLAGEASRDEATALAEWSARSVEHARRLSALRSAWDAAQASVVYDADANHRMIDAVRVMIHASLHARQDTEIASERERAHESFRWARHMSAKPLRGGKRSLRGFPTGTPRDIRYLFPRRLGGIVRQYRGVIATLVGLLVLGAVIRPHALVKMSTASAERTYRTRAGQLLEVTFPDGSRVTLAPATTLQVTTSQTRGGVTVVVDGEAIFDVTHRVRMPFAVRTRSAIVRVLGTRFAVRQYATDHVTRIVVADGRVSLKSRKDPPTGAVMAANSIGVVDDSGHIDVTPNISPTTYTAWTRGELVFLRAPARQIVADLGRAYGADIRVADSALAHHLITWSIPVEQVTLAGALDVLTATLNAHVVRSGNTLTIVPGRTSSAYPRNRDSLTKPERMYGR